MKSAVWFPSKALHEFPSKALHEKTTKWNFERGSEVMKPAYISDKRSKDKFKKQATFPKVDYTVIISKEYWNHQCRKAQIERTKIPQ
jgi:hypothetical protein